MQKQNKKGRNAGKFRSRKASNKDIAQKFSKDRFESDEFKSNSKCAPNDVNWYVPDPQILNDVARIPYSFPVGFPFERRGTLGGVTTPQYDDGVSGILNMAVMPTIGNAKNAGDAVNVAANGMYTFVRHLNSGSRNYFSPDMMIYNLAVDALYYTVSWYTRLYATMTMYSQANRYLPRNLVEAQGVDFDDLMNNLAQFRAGLNLRIPRIATLLVPSVLPIFQRHSWLFQNYYIEGPSEKDQIYMFTPVGYYVFGYRTSDSSGKLFAKRFPSNATVSQLLTILDEMMDPIIDDEDFNIMSGDIYKAYQGNVLKLGLLPDTMTLPLVFNEEVLLQFKNTKSCVVYNDSTNPNYLHWRNNFFDVEQGGANNDHLVTLTPQDSIMTWREMSTGGNNAHYVSPSASTLEKARLRATFNEWTKDTLLTTPHSDVQPAENMVNTRLTLAFDISDNPDPTSVGFTIDRMYFGSEWPLRFNLWTRHRNISTGVVTMFSWTFDRTMIARQLDPGLIQIFRSQWPIISTYRYVPEISIILDEDDAGTLEGAGRSVFELDNYTLISTGVVGRLHDTAIMGEYNIPRIAMFPTR